MMFSAPVCWVVQRCLAKDPAERYDSTRDLYRELKHERERLTEASAPVPQAASSVAHPKRRIWPIAILAGFAMAAVATGAARMIWRTPDPPTCNYTF